MLYLAYSDGTPVRRLRRTRRRPRTHLRYVVGGDAA